MKKLDREYASKPDTRQQALKRPSAKASTELRDDELEEAAGGVYILYNKPGADKTGP